MSVWNPALYLKNAGPRLKPALDLLNRSVVMLETGAKPRAAADVRRVLDLGCGPGNITPFLRQVCASYICFKVTHSCDDWRLLSTGVSQRSDHWCRFQRSDDRSRLC